MLKSIIDIARVKEMGHIVFTANTGIDAYFLGGTTLSTTFLIPPFDEEKAHLESCNVHHELSLGLQRM